MRQGPHTSSAINRGPGLLGNAPAAFQNNGSLGTLFSQAANQRGPGASLGLGNLALNHPQFLANFQSQLQQQQAKLQGVQGGINDHHSNHISNQSQTGYHESVQETKLRRLFQQNSEDMNSCLSAPQNSNLLKHNHGNGMSGIHGNHTPRDRSELSVQISECSQIPASSSHSSSNRQSSLNGIHHSQNYSNETQLPSNHLQLHSNHSQSGNQSQLHSNCSQLHGNHSLSHGNHSQLHGNHSQLHSNHSQLHGNHSQMNNNHSQSHGNHSQLHGNCSQLHGNRSQLHGNRSQLHSNPLHTMKPQQGLMGDSLSSTQLLINSFSQLQRPVEGASTVLSSRVGGGNNSVSTPHLSPALPSLSPVATPQLKSSSQLLSHPNNQVFSFNSNNNNSMNKTGLLPTPQIPSLSASGGATIFPGNSNHSNHRSYNHSNRQDRDRHRDSDKNGFHQSERRTHDRFHQSPHRTQDGFSQSDHRYDRYDRSRSRRSPSRESSVDSSNRIYARIRHRCLSNGSGHSSLDDVDCCRLRGADGCYGNQEYDPANPTDDEELLLLGIKEREHERQERERERERARERVRQQQLQDKFKEDIERPVSGAPLDYINKSYDIAGKMLSDDKKQRIFHAQKKKEAAQRKLTAVTKTKSAAKIPTTKDQRLLIPEKRPDQLTLLQEFGVDTEHMDDMSLQMWLDYVQQWHTYYLNQVKARKDVDLMNVQIRIKVQIQAQIEKEYLNQSKATVEQAQQPVPQAMMMGPQGYMPPYRGAPGYMGPIRYPGPGMEGYYGGGSGGGYMGPPGYMSRPRFRRGFPPRGRGDFGNPRFRGFREPGPHHGNCGPRGPYNGPHQPISDPWGEVDTLEMTGGGEEIPEVVMDINSNMKEGDYTASQSAALKAVHSGGESSKRSRSPQGVPPPDDERISQPTDNNNSQNKKLNSHAAKADSGTNDFHCHACSTKYHSLQNFDEHMNGSAHRQRMQDIYSLQQRAQQHLTQRNKPQSSTKEEDSREFCSICDRHFHGTFLFHKKTDEHKRKDRLTRKGCILCKTGSFVKYPDYVTHIDSAYHKQRKRSDLPTKPAWFECDACDVHVDSPDAFILHCSTLKHNQKKEQLAKDLASRTEATADDPQVKGQQEADGHHGEEGEGHSGSPEAPRNPVPVEEQMDASGIYEEEPDRQPSLCDDRKSSAAIVPIITTAASKLSYDPHNSIGLEFVLPVTGYFCKLCSRFYNNEEMAKGTHCKTERHFQLYQKALESYQKQQASISLQNGLTTPSRSPNTINKHLTMSQLASCGPSTPINTTQTPNKPAPISSKSRTTGRPSSDKASIKPDSVKDCDSHKELIKPGLDKDSHKDLIKPGQDKDSHKDLIKPGQDKDSCRDSVKPKLHKDSIKPDTNQQDQDVKPTTNIKSSSSSDKQDRNDKAFYQPLEKTLALQTKKPQNQEKISGSKLHSSKSQGAKKNIQASAGKTSINETDSGNATNGNTANKPKVTSSNGSSANSNPMVSSKANQTAANKPKVRSTTNGNTANNKPKVISSKAKPGIDPSKTSCDKTKILSDTKSPESQDSMAETVAPPELVLAPPQSLATKTSLSSKVETVAPPETQSELLSGTTLLHGSALKHNSVIKKRTGVIRKSGPASFQAKKVALGAAKNTVLTNSELVVVLNRVNSQSTSWPDDSNSTSESTIINQVAKQGHDYPLEKQSSSVDSYSSSVNKLISNNVNQSCRRKETMTPPSLKSLKHDRSPTCDRSNSDTDSIKSSQTMTDGSREQLSDMVDELMDDTAREMLQEEILQASHADKQHDTNYDTDTNDVDMDLDTASEVSAKILDADGINQVKKMVDNTGENLDAQEILLGGVSSVDNVMMVSDNIMMADETPNTRSDINEGLDEAEDSDTEDKVRAIQAEDNVGSDHGEDEQAGAESDHDDEQEEEILDDEDLENETEHYDEDELSDRCEHYDDTEIIDQSEEVTNEPLGEDFEADYQSPHDLDQVDGIIETESQLLAGDIVKTCEDGEGEDNCVLEKMSASDYMDKNDCLKPLEESTKHLVVSHLDSLDLDNVVSASEQKLIPVEITQISLSLDKHEALEDPEMQVYGKDLNENKSNPTTHTKVSDPSSESEQSVGHKSEKNETDTRTGSETNGKTCRIRKRRFAPDFDELVNINATLKKHSKGRTDKSDNQSINESVNLHPSDHGLGDKTHSDWENQEYSSGLRCETNDAGEIPDGKFLEESQSNNSLKSGGKIPINISCDALSSPKRRLRKK